MYLTSKKQKRNAESVANLTAGAVIIVVLLFSIFIN
jgi:hypothetical protein